MHGTGSSKLQQEHSTAMALQAQPGRHGRLRPGIPHEDLAAGEHRHRAELAEGDPRQFEQRGSQELDGDAVQEVWRLPEPSENLLATLAALDETMPTRLAEALLKSPVGTMPPVTRQVQAQLLTAMCFVLFSLSLSLSLCFLLFLYAVANSACLLRHSVHALHPTCPA